MIKTHEEEVVFIDNVVDEILCNCCGNEITRNYIEEDNEDSFIEFDDHLQVDKEWGYFSNHDTETHKFHLCNQCYDDFITTFKIPVAVEEYM